MSSCCNAIDVGPWHSAQGADGYVSPCVGFGHEGLVEILYYVNFIVFIIFDMHFHYYMCVHKFGMLIIAINFVKLSVYIICVVKMLKIILLCACCYFIV